MTHNGTFARLNRVPYLFLAPFLACFLLFGLGPILYTLVISFMRWQYTEPVSFAGLANYHRVFVLDRRFLIALGNTILILLQSLPLTIVLSLTMAYVINSRLVPFRKFFQLANFLPYVTAPVAIGVIFSILFDFKYGTINQVLVALGVLREPIDWLGKPFFARLVVSLTLVWNAYGYTIVMFIAGMSAIPDEMYEAAAMDGANTVQRYFRITLPMLRPVITFIVVTGVIGNLQQFDIPYLLFSGGLATSQPFGGPKLSCLTMVMHFYDAAFRSFDLGYGAAIAYSMFLVIAVFSFIVFRLLLRRENDG